jgi:hypothetical protein
VTRNNPFMNSSFQEALKRHPPPCRISEISGRSQTGQARFRRKPDEA